MDSQPTQVMSTVFEEAPGGSPGSTLKNSRAGRSTAPFSHHRAVVHHDIPSLKYNNIEEPVNKVTLRRAQSPPKPTLPRRQHGRTWNATAKERNPLASSLTGPGRAGKYGELIGETGGRYEGEVLAGRPHGHGRYLMPKDDGSGQMMVQYEGEWVQGRKEGTGTRHYLNGESYSGDFVANIRHGYGRYFFASGDVYSGEWVDDRRTGQGTYFYANGDIFVGNFIKDRKEGLGTLYMVTRQKKYMAEYVGGQPKCGSIMGIEDADLQPLQGQLAALALQRKLDLNASGRLPPQLPELELSQPNRVLAEQVVAVRKGRSEGSKDMRLVQATSGTLSDKEVEMLRHSYTLMAAGDDLKAGLLAHQLRELCVMAGLDPAADATRGLVELLLERRDTRTGRITFDDFMKVVIHFQEKPQGPAGLGASDSTIEGGESEEQVYMEGSAVAADASEGVVAADFATGAATEDTWPPIGSSLAAQQAQPAEDAAVDGDEYTEEQIRAVTKIQAAGRGMLDRKKVAAMKNEQGPQESQLVGTEGGEQGELQAELPAGALEGEQVESQPAAAEEAVAVAEHLPEDAGAATADGVVESPPAQEQAAAA